MYLISIQAFKRFLTEQENSNNLTSHGESVSSPLFGQVREGTFFIGGGGWAGASEGRVLSKFFTNWGGSKLFYSQPGEGHRFFGKEKITPCLFYFVYTSKATSQD